MIAGGGEQSQLEGSAPPTHTQPQPHSLFPAGPTQSRSRPPRRGRVAVGGGGGMGRAGGRDRLVRRLTRPKPPALASMASPRSRGGGGAERASTSGFYVYRPAVSAGSAWKSTLPAGPSSCGPGRRMDAVRPAPGGLGARRPTARTALWNGRPGHLESVQTQPELRAAAIASGLLRIAASRAVGAFRVCRAAAQAAGGCLQVAVFLLPAGEADCLVHKGPSSQWGISSRPTAL